MNDLVIIVFTITLIFIGITERYRRYAWLIGFQGLLLFILSLLEMQRFNLATLLFVASETLLFKVIIVPWLMIRIINKTGVERIHENLLPGFYSLVVISLGLLLSIVVSLSLKTPSGNLVYFIGSLSAIYTGLFLIISHQKILSHLAGFLVIENAVLLLSMGIGSQIPMLLNIGILLDIFVSVLILGLFVMRLKQHTSDLTMLKDE